MRRRSLFAGLAGLLAAPKVAAAAPTVGSSAAGVVHRQVFTEWVVGEAAEFDFVAGGVAGPGGAVTLFGNDCPEAILPLSRDAAGRLRVRREADAAGPAADAVQPLPQPAHGPIGVTWAGFQDPDPRAPVSPRADARG